ncbi:MAG TPA: response regulator [Candidatus Methylacidiphilales bacterium]|jgi:CheY-like chemotaxis protein|nr:response regulator [Candidatus Methylacidiphilales bacterium]
MHILLVDDSSSTRSLLRTLINSGQTVRHEISEAAGGEEALQKVGSGEINLPDLVIMDINMGGMSGYDLCREFRQRHGTASEFVPYIIIVTANEGVDVINQALDCGANDYMPKPVNVKILHVRLRVAERLLAQGRSGSNPATSNLPKPKDDGAAPAADKPKEAAAAVDPVTSLVASSIEYADAPMAILDVAGAQPTFNIVYANSTLAQTTSLKPEELIGQSLAEIEAWTPEFVDLVLGYIDQGTSLSHAPLWSRTRQSVPVHLSFYPIRGGDGPPTHYLVIHHF